MGKLFRFQIGSFKVPRLLLPLLVVALLAALTVPPAAMAAPKKDKTAQAQAQAERMVEAAKSSSTEKRFVIHVDGDRFTGRVAQNSVGKWLVWIPCAEDPFATRDFRKHSDARKSARLIFPEYTRRAHCPPS